MDVGMLALACLWLALGQASDEPTYSNQRGYRIPADVELARRAEIKNLLLYGSSDLGRSWQIVGSTTPDKNHFLYFAPGDGTYRLKAACVYQNGRQEPADPSAGPPDQIIVVDTAKPIVHSLEARRVGDEIVVRWQLQEEHPDWSSFRLEYQAAGGGWAPLKAQPSLSGQESFRSDGPQTPIVRLSLRDRAGNQSYATTGDVSGSPITTTQMTAPATLPPATPVVPPSLVAQIPLPAAPLTAAPVTQQPTPAPQTQPMPAPQTQPTPALQPLPPPTPRALPTPPQPPAALPVERVVADTQWNQPRLPGGAMSPTSLTGPGGVSQVTARTLKPVQYVSQQKVALGFEVSKLGPSGVGSLQLWCTKNDGQSWELYAEDRSPSENGNGRQQLNVPLEEDGLYGFTLVVKNRAGLGKPPPRPGEAPEMRLELDTTPPSARLLAPEPDRERIDAAVLTWVAQDKNLSDRPINLEWSDRRDGPWRPIAAELPNDGRYSWQPPREIPAQIYLRLRVRDAAGNESIAVTREPQLIDLSEPEVRLINVIQPGRQ